MPYQPYIRTQEALRGLGSTFNELANLGIKKRELAMQGKLQESEMGLKRASMEAQNDIKKLGIMGDILREKNRKEEADRRIAAIKESNALREKEMTNKQTLEQNKLEVNTFGNHLTTRLTEAGLDRDEIEKSLKKYPSDLLDRVGRYDEFQKAYNDAQAMTLKNQELFEKLHGEGKIAALNQTLSRFSGNPDSPLIVALKKKADKDNLVILHSEIEEEKDVSKPGEPYDSGIVGTGKYQYMAVPKDIVQEVDKQLKEKESKEKEAIPTVPTKPFEPPPIGSVRVGVSKITGAPVYKTKDGLYWSR